MKRKYKKEEEVQEKYRKEEEDGQCKAPAPGVCPGARHGAGLAAPELAVHGHIPPGGGGSGGTLGAPRCNRGGWRGHGGLVVWTLQNWLKGGTEVMWKHGLV